MGRASFHFLYSLTSAGRTELILPPSSPVEVFTCFMNRKGQIGIDLTEARRFLRSCHLFESVPLAEMLGPNLLEAVFVGVLRRYVSESFFALRVSASDFV